MESIWHKQLPPSFTSDLNVVDCDYRRIGHDVARVVALILLLDVVDEQ